MNYLINKYLKVYRRLYNPIYIKRVNAKIAKVNENNKAEENLDERFVDTRDQFESDMDKIKSIALKILLMIDYLSVKHDFSYSLSYGTLLGAVRHNGFIPWDDDIDIMMTKKDLEKFISVAYDFPPSIHVFAYELNFIKVMDRYSKMSIDGKRGVAVDIFIADDDDSKISFLNVHTRKTVKFDHQHFLPLKREKFETAMLPVPQNPDNILSTIYGDYMKLPPVDQRVSRHVNDESIKISEFPKNA